MPNVSLTRPKLWLLKAVLAIVLAQWLCGPVIAAFAGFLFACVQMVVAPEYAGFVFGTELVIWVALGGRGSLIGPIVGAISIDVGSAYLSGNLPYIWTLLVGVAFVTVIVAMPRGLAPLVAAAARQALPRRRRAAPVPVSCHA